jgi:hypothetical protein
MQQTTEESPVGTLAKALAKGSIYSYDAIEQNLQAVYAATGGDIIKTEEFMKKVLGWAARANSGLEWTTKLFIMKLKEEAERKNATT